MSSQNTSKAFRFVDLFAGLGGFHVGLKALHGEAVFAAEWDPTLNKLYENNFGLSPWGDIDDLDTPEKIRLHIPDHEVLAAGFPCQPFSKAGEQAGFEHTTQGRLFFKVLDILEHKRPARFILENVPNILHHNQGDTLNMIKRRIRELGYEVRVLEYSPHQFGIPQIRNRAYFIGSLDGLSTYIQPTPTTQPTSVKSVINYDSLPDRQISPQTNYAIDMWNDFLRRAPRSVKLPSFPLWSMESEATYPYHQETPQTLWNTGDPHALDQYAGSFGQSLARKSRDTQATILPSHALRSEGGTYPKWKRDFIRQNREFWDHNSSWTTPWLQDWRPWQLPTSLQKFEWNAQGGNRDIDDYVLQVRASGIRVKRPVTAPSLVAMTSTQVPILGGHLAGRRRYMTVDECAQLQSLESIRMPSPAAAAYKALGNAVNAEVIEALARPLIDTLNPKVHMKLDSDPHNKAA